MGMCTQFLIFSINGLGANSFMRVGCRSTLNLLKARNCPFGQAELLPNVLQISHGWFHWLVNAVVEAPCNKDKFMKEEIAETK